MQPSFHELDFSKKTKWGRNLRAWWLRRTRKKAKNTWRSLQARHPREDKAIHCSSFSVHRERMKLEIRVLERSFSLISLSLPLSWHSFYWAQESPHSPWLV